MLRATIRPILIVALLGFTAPLLAQEVHEAVQSGETAGVEALLSEEPSLLGAVDDNGRRPLLLAALSWHLDIATLLLEMGAELEVADSRGFAPLGLAVARGSREMIELLLDAGASPISS